MAMNKPSLTRRTLLQMMGAVGGASAVYDSAVALGMVTTPDPWAGPLEIPAGTGNGQSVLVLGAGIGGLTTAYELRRAGFAVTILEAQGRAGGRSLTARKGTVIPQQGMPDQTAELSEGLYVNMGPGRLPYHHRRALHYCHVLDVALEVYNMTTTANLFQKDQAFGGAALIRRQIQNDTRGYIAELLAKSVRRHDIDAPLSHEDKERLLDLLRVFGDLQERTLRFDGTTRSGCRFPITVYDPCEPEPPLPLDALLASEFWQDLFYQFEEFEWQATLFQPVGGMDKIVSGFLRSSDAEGGERLGALIRYGAAAKRIDVGDHEVRVAYEDAATGERHTAIADYCVSNMPLPVLQQLHTNFSPSFHWAVNEAQFAPTCKVGWEATERFWESDRYQIYGGISVTNNIITQIWYPSNGYFGQRGTLTGLYNFEQNAIDFGKLNLTERLRVARDGAARLHPEFASDAIVPEHLGLSIAWHHVPYQLGGWADWTSADPRAYRRLLEPDRRFHIVGDQVSQLPGWQEGAMMSAEHVVRQIAGLSTPGITIGKPARAPDTRRLVKGLY